MAGTTQKKRKKHIVQIVKRILISVIISLSAFIAILILRLGENSWTAWLIEYRVRIIGIASLALVFVMLLAPVIMEVTRNTRTLSGPGKNPYIDP